MTFYEFSVITNTGFPYYNLKLKEQPKSVNLYLRFFDFSGERENLQNHLDPQGSFELNAGLISALFEFARNIDKKIEVLEFKHQDAIESKNKYKGDVLITTQTETFLFHKSVKAKINLIYENIISEKIPLDSAYQIIQTEEDEILRILTDQTARKVVEEEKKDLKKLVKKFMDDMKDYGLIGASINTFDLSPIEVFGEKYTIQDVQEILRNLGFIPDIAPLEWIYRQSFYEKETLWVYIINSSIGPTIEGNLFEPYFYLLFAQPQSYLGEFPGKFTAELNKILG